MFLRQEDFATVVRSTPLVSLDFIVENSRGEFLLGKRTNRPAQGYWFVPGGRVQKDETLEAAFERLTMAELGLRLPITAGQFTVSGSTFMTITSPARNSPLTMWCSVFASELRKMSCYCRMSSMTITAG